MRKILFLFLLLPAAVIGQREFTKYKVDGENKYLNFSFPGGEIPADPPSVTIRTKVGKSQTERFYYLYRLVEKIERKYPTYLIIDGFTAIGSLRMITDKRGEMVLDNEQVLFTAMK